IQFERGARAPVSIGSLLPTARVSSPESICVQNRVLNRSAPFVPPSPRITLRTRWYRSQTPRNSGSPAASFSTRRISNSSASPSITADSDSLSCSDILRTPPSNKIYISTRTDKWTNAVVDGFSGPEYPRTHRAYWAVHDLGNLFVA